MTVTRDSTTIDMSVQLGSLTLANPTITLSGTCGYGDEYAPFMDLRKLGAFTTKSVTLHSRRGNPPPRVVETSGGMLNAIGLANVGLERFLAEKLPVLAKLDVPALVNVAGHSMDEYVAVCRALDPEPAVAGSAEMRIAHLKQLPSERRQVRRTSHASVRSPSPRSSWYRSVAIPAASKTRTSNPRISSIVNANICSADGLAAQT